MQFYANLPRCLARQVLTHFCQWLRSPSNDTAVVAPDFADGFQTRSRSAVEIAISTAHAFVCIGRAEPLLRQATIHRPGLRAALNDCQSDAASAFERHSEQQLVAATSRCKLIQRLILLLLAATFAFAPSAVAQEQKQPLRFLGNKSIPPFISLQNGKPVGIVVDLAYALANDAGLSITVEAMDWSTAQSEVLHGKADALLQINPNPQREQIYDFSDPVLESRFQIFRKANRTDIQSLASLRGMKVGVESGGFPAQHLEEGGEFQLVMVPSWRAAFILLNAGQVDAVIVDRWVGEYELALNRFEGITIVDPPVAHSYSRFAVAKGNKDLLDRINFGLNSIKRNGTYQKILDKWQPLSVIYVTSGFMHDVEVYAIVACGAVIAVLCILIINASQRKRLLATLEQRIKERTQELEAHKASLENTINARTRELAKSNERLMAVNDELESFSYSVSHDLRAPLRVIDGFSQFLLEEQESGLSQEGMRLLNVIRTHTTQMSQLIDDILAFSRTGRAELRRTDVDMADIARAAYDELVLGTAGRPIEFRLGLLPRVQADAAMMRQVFANLLANAIKYSAPTPNPLIEVEGRIQGGEAIYLVKDNGVGFDMKDAGKLFGVFQRLHGPAEFPGTGIGLSIVKRIITRHGGRVWAEGKVGEGATFGFALPVRETART